MEVSLMEMLDARERRAQRQMQLLQQYGRPLICFTMNIAGPIKNSPLIHRGFLMGKRPEPACSAAALPTTAPEAVPTP